ncbi:Glucan 1,3-beta-glucosidase 3 [Monascus purpureus]|uniref:Glucan 1,3-beta-glucosidase 3 n=1 Tax=Monascus purpureus TaxID=5098 RepID=A0A507QTP4_MONPU|nr:Glucan 1,3-beta-glucosidase 3 [Monascus purpureus]
MDPTPPTVQDIFRYRYQHGTNLGATFVLERWLRGSMYSHGTVGSSELAAVKRIKWETHWLTALNEDDFRWLRDVARCNSIRLPIGFFTLGPIFCVGTVFEGEPAQVYVNAWNAVKNLIEDCGRHGIGVLIDLHAAPGGANRDSHSGTDSGKAELWESKHNRALARGCITYIVREVTYHGMANVIGVEVCNEAIWNAPGMYEWYDEILEATGALDATLPIYISDGWNLSCAVQYAMSKNTITSANPLLNNPMIVDTHKYYTFTEKDRSMSPQAIIERVKGVLSELPRGSVFDRKGAVAVYIGEYSCTMDGQTWSHVDPSQRPQLTQVFGQTQTMKWVSKTSGSAFWTLKMDWMDGGDWGFKKQVNTGAIPAPSWLTIPLSEIEGKVEEAETQRNQLCDKAFSDHVRYWDSKTKNSSWDHSRFARGWELGFADAKCFFCAGTHGIISGHGDIGGDRIGAIDLWVRKRIVETGQVKEGLGWEWEHGFRKGMADFYALFDV